MGFKFARMKSPVGLLLLIGDESALWRISIRPVDVEAALADFSARIGTSDLPEEETTPLLEQAIAELKTYFECRAKTFSVPLHLVGTPFQKKVWQALQEIPYGQVRSYADIARRIGSPRAVRAVGSANGKNPIPIIVPCHRVVNTGAGLGGYSGGLDVKRFLLTLEGAQWKESRKSRLALQMMA